MAEQNHYCSKALIRKVLNSDSAENFHLKQEKLQVREYFRKPAVRYPGICKKCLHLKPNKGTPLLEYLKIHTHSAYAK